MEFSVAGKDIELRQSPGLLSSSRKEGTTGAVIWKVSPPFADWISKANFLHELQVLRSDSVVLELGCGIAGIVALALAQTVRTYVATDQDYVLKLLRDNIAENQKPAIARAKGKTPRKSSSADIRLALLDWETDEVSSLPRTLHLGNEGDGFDLVLACDCIYNESLIEPFVSTCRQACELRSQTEESVARHPTLCVVAQQLRTPEVFEKWAANFQQHFWLWRLPDSVLSPELRENSGYVVHVGILR